MNSPRILVCGNRNWTCRRTIARWLIHACQLARGINGVHLDGDPVLIHGANGKCDQNGKPVEGADLIAEWVAVVKLGWLPEAYPARWELHGNAAGPIRNAEMAKAGAHIGVAFGALSRGSKRTGTGDMVQRCLDVGIPTIVIAKALP